MEQSIIERVKKLLALGESPNENEAQTAMLKARELMAKYKIELKEIEGEQQQTVENKKQVEYTSKKGKWILTLSSIIAENYSCIAYGNKTSKFKGYVVLAGYSKDLELCSIVLNYALDSIQTWMGKQEKRLKKAGLSCKDISEYTNNYAWGFITGLQDLYEEQNAQNQQWGLVMVTPKEVKDVTKGMSTVKARTHANSNTEAFSDGYCDGNQFTPNSRLEY
jgi:hypothetical protein